MSAQHQRRSHSYGYRQEYKQEYQAGEAGEKDPVHLVEKTVKQFLEDLREATIKKEYLGNIRFHISRITTHTMRYTGRRERFEKMFPRGSGFQVPWTDAKKGMVKLEGLAKHPMINCEAPDDLSLWAEVLALENCHKRDKGKDPLYKFWKIGRGNGFVEVMTMPEIRYSATPGDYQIQVKVQTDCHAGGGGPIT